MGQVGRKEMKGPVPCSVVGDTTKEFVSDPEEGVEQLEEVGE